MPLPLRPDSAVAYILYIGLSVVLRGRHSERLFPFIQSPRLAMPCSISDHSVEVIVYTLYVGQSGAQRDRCLKGLALSAVFLRYSKQDSVPNHRASLLHTIHGY